MAFRITLTGKQAAAALKALEKNTRTEIAKAYTTIGVMLKGQLTQAAPRDTGTLANAHAFAVDKQRLILRVFNRKAHAVYVHDGRKPGRMPPVSALRSWAARKLGDPRLAFVVARAIARKGIRARPWFTTTIKAHEPTIRTIMQKAIERTAVRFNRPGGK